jgi:hypothetical protein
MLRSMLLASVAFTCAFAFHHPNAHPLTNFLPAAARRQPQGRVCSASMLGHRKHSVPGKIGTKGFANAAIQKVFHGYSVVLLHAQGEKPAEEAANTAIQSFFHAYSKTLLLIQNEGVKPAQGLANKAIQSFFHAYSTILLQVQSLFRGAENPEGVGFPEWESMSKGPALAAGWKRHDQAVMDAMALTPESQALNQNAQRKAYLRERLRRRLGRSQDSPADGGDFYTGEASFSV